MHKLNKFNPIKELLRKCEHLKIETGEVTDDDVMIYCVSKDYIDILDDMEKLISYIKASYELNNRIV